MKKNGKNIITSEDVTVLGKNIGKTLGEVLETLLEDSLSLKSNIKWIYKYGGVGSNGGGGGSSSITNNWSAICRLGDKLIPEETPGDIKSLLFLGSGTYKLYLHINNPGGDSYSVLYSVNNGKSKGTAILNVDNRWTKEVNVNLLENGEVTISVMNGDSSEKSFKARHIIKAYSIETYLTDSTGSKYGTQDGKYNLFIEDIKEKGLQLNVKYNSSVNIPVTYIYLKFNSEEEIRGEAEFKDGDYLKTLLNIEAFDNLDSLTDNDASLYIFKIKFIIDGSEIVKDISADFLPNNLYLKIIPEDSETILYPTEVNNPQTLMTGNRSFIITPYNGKGGSAGNIRCTYYINDVQVVDSTTSGITEDISLPGKAFRRTLLFQLPGKNKIEFRANLGDFSASFIYYFYTEEATEIIDWFDSNYNSSAYYRYSQGNNKMYRNGNLIDSSTYIIKNANDNINLDIINSLETTFSQEILINIGILYNYINNENDEIIEIPTNSAGDTNSIHIYLNKFLIGNSLLLGIFYLEEEEKYNSFDNKKYHLITIARKFIRSTGISENKYEVSVYIDGILLANTGVHLAPSIYNSFILKKGNYSINLLDITYFNNNSIKETDVVRYWYAYLTRVQNDNTNFDRKSNLLNIFKGFNLEKINDLYSSHVKVAYSTLTNLIHNITIPVMCIEYNPEVNKDVTGNPIKFFDWSDYNYAPDSNIAQTLTIGLKWSDGSGTFSTELEDIDISAISTLDGQSKSGKFILDILGSTTRSYKSKNYTLGLEFTDSDNSFIPIFTPWFNLNDTNSFLPENSFTLKADVVDSSHTNNTCMGKFINANTNKFDDAKQRNSIYSNHIKNCLEGFPYLMFVHSSGENDYYFLGIYNFNLGRTSNFNLGYSNLKALPNLHSSENYNFNVYSVPRTTTSLWDGAEILNGLITAEIDGNESWFDFSQYDKSILFPVLTIPNDSGYMFSEIVSGKDTAGLSENTKNIIAKFVERTSRGGGFIFDKIEKGFHDDIQKNYTSQKGYVPNARKLYSRSKPYDEYIYTLIKEILPKSDEDFKEADFLNYIFTHSENDVENVAPYSNYRSIIEYYTICMAFGLLDSVLKNLNIKSWNSGNTFYLAFYDMDTCLGINNDGENVSYYAFSDYWESPESTIIDYDVNGIPIVSTPSINVTRDFAPKSSDSSLYDIPSSYIFAIAKYAKSIIECYKITSEESLIDPISMVTPLNLWAEWRSTNGSLENASSFIDNYYNGYMKGVDELMFNYNFKAKYFKEKSDSSYDEEFTRFRGRSIGYVKDWLTKRFHILDAYFNLEANKGIFITDGANYEQALIEDSGYEIVYELYPVNVLNYSDDVNINKSIFGQNQSISGDIDIIVQAPDYTPIIATVGRNMYRYLLENSSNKYNIKIRNTGTNKVIFGGSSMWTYIDSINSLANGTVTLISDKLLTLNGNRGSVNGWDLNMPALQELHLNGADYAGDLIFDKNSLVYNLTNVDISSSKINLTVNSLNVRTINLSNIHSGSINISQCNLLENIIFSNTAIQNCTIEVNYLSNEKTFTLSNNNILNLNLSTKNNLNLVIENDRTLKSLIVEGFKTITIKNCPLLETIESSKEILTSIITDKCPLVKSVYLNINNCKTINIHNSVLEELTLSTTNGNYSSIETLIIPQSRIKKILYLKVIEGIPTEDSQYSEQNNTINLIPLINLNNFNISGNNLILYIKFPNDFNKPIPIRNTFEGCSELLRIYGCINIVNSNNTFYNLQKFSVHGNNNTWKNYSIFKEKIINGTTYHIVQTPLLLLSGELETDTHDDIITKYNNLSKSDLFDNSETATNIFFDVNMLGSFTYFMLNTNISLFDVYYLLNSFGLSNINHNVTIGDGAFHSLLSMFNYENGNQFNRYTFYKCSRITNFSASSTVFTTGITLWYSPTIENGQIKYDNGLFSPLINLLGITRFSGPACIDRFIFRKKNNSEKYNLYNFTWQDIYLVCDDIGLLKVLPQISSFISGKDILSEYLNKIGNMTDIFKLTNISTLYCVFNMSIINYDTLTFPTTISSIGYAFLNTYGFGKFKWDKVFDFNSNYNNLTAIYNAFILNDYLGNNFVEFEIFDNMFKNMPNLVYLGANYDRSGGGFYDNEASTVFPNFSYGFRGNGFSKIFRNNEVPNNITLYIPKIKNFIGLFSELYTKVNVPDIQMDFPGNLFLNTLDLENISALFADCRIRINLTSEGFKNCKKLKGISRLFYMTVNLNIDNNIPRTILNVSIPYKFFYLGDITSTKQYYGTNDINIMNADIEYMENPESETANQFDPTQEGNHITIILKNPIKNILFATECFHGQDKIKGYEWNEDENFDITEYPNNNYIPFAYYKEGEVWKERPNDPKYTKLYDISSIYDGNPIHLKEEAYCLDSEQVEGFTENTLKKSNIVNYFCPPDLFNSFINNTSLNINGMFKWCGVGANNIWSFRLRGENLLNIMYGRICPYLFNTVNNVKYLTEFFENCKGLNSYKINNLIYLIPPKLFENTINLSGLAKTFSGIYFDSNPNFAFLSYLGETLDVRGIFSMCLYAQGWSISNIFSLNTLGQVSGAFSARVIDFSNNSYGVIANTVVNNVNEEIPPCNFSNNITSSNNSQKLIIKNNTGFVYFRVGNNKVLDSVIDLDHNNNLNI